ncbi:hypothetical protein OQA88_12335 [Cercophora sp. LCS_1]
MSTPKPPNLSTFQSRISLNLSRLSSLTSSLELPTSNSTSTTTTTTTTTTTANTTAKPKSFSSLTTSTSTSTSATPTQQIQPEDDLKNPGPPNAGVGFVPARETSAKETKNDQLRAQLLGRGARGRNGNAKDGKVTKKREVESESEEELGRSAVGKKRRVGSSNSNGDEGSGGKSGKGKKGELTMGGDTVMGGTDVPAQSGRRDVAMENKGGESEAKIEAGTEENGNAGDVDAKTSKEEDGAVKADGERKKKKKKKKSKSKKRNGGQTEEA